VLSQWNTDVPHWQCLKNYVERKEIFSMIEMNVDHVRVQDATDSRIIILKAKAMDRYLDTCLYGSGNGKVMPYR
jgi:hypothetical protein